MARDGEAGRGEGRRGDAAAKCVDRVQVLGPRVCDQSTPEVAEGVVLLQTLTGMGVQVSSAQTGRLVVTS